MLILYGSETGTAQDFAEQIWHTCKHMFQNAAVECFSFDDYKIETLGSETIAIFVVATSGQGEMTTNMRTNWRFLLSRKLCPDWLSNLNFAVLALGDSSYQKYNFAGKKLYRRLIQLSAKPIVDLALADEQHKLGVDDVFEKWQPELIKRISFLMKTIIDANPFERNSRRMEPKFLVEFPPTDDMPDSSKFYPVTLIGNERLTDARHFQETRLLTFNSDLKYSPGDVLMVLPENLPESIEIARSVLTQCKRDSEKPFHICRSDKNVPLRPQHIRLFTSTAPTLLNCLHFYFDLQSIPKRIFIRQFASCSSDPLERDRLFELASEDGIDDYLEYCHRSKRTMAEFLRDFPKTSACLTPSDLFEFFPVIRARAFSIASSPRAHPRKIQILVAKVVYSVRKMATQRLGLCSNFLCTRAIGDRVYIKTRPGIFKYRPTEPLILIGPGTGVAPHRSIIAENETVHPGTFITLFFGCRGSQKDFYFQNEWPLYTKTRTITAFSRDQEKKIYVQHKMREHSMHVWEILQNNGRIFIAGSAGDMPKAVINALTELIRKVNNFTEVEAEEYVEKLERNGRILYETWG